LWAADPVSCARVLRVMASSDAAWGADLDAGVSSNSEDEK